MSECLAPRVLRGHVQRRDERCARRIVEPASHAHAPRDVEVAAHAGEQHIALELHRAGGRAHVGERLPGEQALELAAHDSADLLLCEPDGPRTAQRDDRVELRVSVGRVAAEEDPPGRDEREQREQVGGQPPRRVEQDVRVVVELVGDPREVGDRGVGEDERRAREALGQSQRIAAQRLDAEPGVDEHRQGVLVSEGEDRLDPGGARLNCSARGCSLIPRAPRGDRPCTLRVRSS